MKDLIYVIFVGLIAGWMAGKLMKGRGFGLIGNLVVGVVGSVLGGYLFSALGISLGSGIISSIIAASCGALVLLFLIGLIKNA